MEDTTNIAIVRTDRLGTAVTSAKEKPNFHMVEVLPLKGSRGLFTTRIYKLGGTAFLQTILNKEVLKVIASLIRWDRIQELPDGCQIIPSNDGLAFEVVRNGILTNVVLGIEDCCLSLMKPATGIPIFDSTGTVLSHVDHKGSNVNTWPLVKATIGRVF